MKYLLKFVDSCIYLFIGPFTILYIIPLFFRGIESNVYTLPSNDYVDYLGIFFMWFGGALAFTCGVMFFLNKYGSVVPFFKPTQLVTKGPFALVRHPMMWALFLVLIGESLSFSSPFTFGWFIIWARCSHIYICRYEEPFLLRHFGEIYQQYAEKVPRWIPGIKAERIG